MIGPSRDSMMFGLVLFSLKGEFGIVLMMYNAESAVVHDRIICLLIPCPSNSAWVLVGMRTRWLQTMYRMQGDGHEMHQGDHALDGCDLVSSTDTTHTVYSMLHNYWVAWQRGTTMVRWYIDFRQSCPINHR